jgi:endonuclease IV
MRLGFHLSIAGSMRRAVYQAQVLGCQALQIFVQNPRGWKWHPVTPAEIRDFSRARRQAGLGPLVVHLGYLPNLATADPALYALSTERLLRELLLARELAADYLVVHPGHGPLGEASFGQVAGPWPWRCHRRHRLPWCSWKIPPVRDRNWAGVSTTWTGSLP